MNWFKVLAWLLLAIGGGAMGYLIVTGVYAIGCIVFDMMFSPHTWTLPPA